VLDKFPGFRALLNGQETFGRWYWAPLRAVTALGFVMLLVTPGLLTFAGAVVIFGKISVHVR
jgi:hypothetical protein